MAQDVDKFLIQTLLAGAFSGQSDRVIDALVSKFKELNCFDGSQGLNVIREQGRNLKISRDKFFGMGYGSKNIHLVLNLWYRTFHHTPAYDNNLPQVDHIFPQVHTAEIPKDKRNQLANCMLLTAQENGAGGKGDQLPYVWLNRLNDQGNRICDESYLNLHCIPRDRALWALDRFDEFMEARKILIAQKFDWLIDPPAINAGAGAPANP